MGSPSFLPPFLRAPPLLEHPRRHCVTRIAGKGGRGDSVVSASATASFTPHCLFAVGNATDAQSDGRSDAHVCIYPLIVTERTDGGNGRIDGGDRSGANKASGAKCLSTAVAASAVRVRP